MRTEHVDTQVRLITRWDDVEGEQLPNTDAGIRTVTLVGRLRSEPGAEQARDRTRRRLPLFRRDRDDRDDRADSLDDSLAGAAGMERGALEPLQPHEARHTCAPYLAAAGLTPKDLQTAIGHANVATTLGLYAKSIPGWERDAAEKVDE